MTSARLLKIIFVILILVTLGELGYYVYIQFNKEKYAEDRSSNIVSEKSVIPTIVLQERLIPSQSIEYLKTDYLPSLEKIPKSDSRKFYIVEENNGYVGEFKLDDRKKGYILKIIDEKGNTVISYFISEKNIEKKKFLRMFQDTKVPISYKDIKEGEKIIITIKEDLVNPGNSYDEYLFTE